MLVASSAARAPRRAFTLTELLVGMSVAGVVLALLTAIGVREQRAFADLTEQGIAAGQLREAAALLPIDLRALSPAAGDIRDARDTAIEVRATVASAVVCDSTAGGIVLAPDVGAATTFTSDVAAIDAGDTAWILTAHDSVDAWQPFGITAVATAAAGGCADGGPRPVAPSGARTKLSISASPAASLIGAPLRVTRPVRYSIYRASDGAWYLGERDWNPASLAFNTVQPVAGPLRSASAGGLTFAYFDSAGATLATPVAAPSAIRRIDINLRTATRRATRSVGARPTAPHLDSALVELTLRNR